MSIQCMLITSSVCSECKFSGKIKMSVHVINYPHCLYRLRVWYGVQVPVYARNCNSLRETSHMFYTPSFTLLLNLFSRKGETRGAQNKGLFSVS